MVKSRKNRQRHVPQRTCVGCRGTIAKRSLIRIVCTADGVQVDPKGKMPGRGAYLHDRQDCWRMALKRGALSRALRVEMTEEDRIRLADFSAQLDDE